MADSSRVSSGRVGRRGDAAAGAASVPGQILPGSEAASIGIGVVLADTFLMFGGFFMVIPIVAVYYVENLGWSAAVIGGALALRQTAQQGLSVLGGAFADRFGARRLVWAGLLVRAISFVAMAWATTLPLLLVSMFLAALGGALFESPRQAIITALTTSAERRRLFAVSGVVGSIGMTVGPLVGALLLTFDFVVVALAAAACFVLAFAITWFWLPPVAVAEGRQAFSFGLRLALSDRPFVAYTAFLMGYWYLWVQLALALPLAGTALGAGSEVVGWIYAVNAGLGVALQYPALRLSERWLSPRAALVLGVAVMGLGLAGVIWATTLPALLVCVAVFSIGGVFAAPSHQTVTASLADRRALGSYFGVNALALSVGGGLGNLSAGVLIDVARAVAWPPLPWVVCALVAAVSAAGLAVVPLRPRAGEEAERD